MPKFSYQALSLIALLLLQVEAQAAPSCKNERNEVLVSTEKNKFGHKALKASIKINASPKLVWEAITAHRESDPDVAFSKITYISESEKVLEQKYVSLPVLGATTCTLHLNEELYKRIDYHLTKSDRISAFEGSWILSSQDGDSTELELTNHLKLHMPIPQKIVDAFSAPKLKARLAHVKQLAEAKRQTQIASRD